MFEPFPSIKYNNQIVKDITQRVDFLKKIKNNILLFEYYFIKDKETPESLANKFYNNPDYLWIILFLNDIIDPYNDWPMDDTHLLTYVQEKYGEENVYDVNHYEDIDGNWVTTSAYPVSNYDYESKLNEEKRKIKLLKPIYLQQVVTEYSNSLAQQNVNK